MKDAHIHMYIHVLCIHIYDCTYVHTYVHMYVNRKILNVAQVADIIVVATKL